MAHGVDLMAENRHLVDLLCDPSIAYTPPPSRRLIRGRTASRSSACWAHAGGGANSDSAGG